MSFQDYSDSITARLHMGKAKAAGIAGLCILLFIVAVIVISSISSAGNGFEVSKAAASDIESSQDVGSSDSAEDGESGGDICVDVAGCVVSPGVCYLKEGSRVADAIAAAGGFREDAVISAVNQARVLADGEQLYVPSESESSVAAASADSPSASGDVGGKVNINTADSTQLQTISGIGQSKADKIIAYRSANGPFSSVDDLVNVSGIGEKTLEAIRGSICV